MPGKCSAPLMGTVSFTHPTSDAVESTVPNRAGRERWHVKVVGAGWRVVAMGEEGCVRIAPPPPV